jgi:predicted nuclease of predicted toxin-antitoxin system
VRFLADQDVYAVTIRLLRSLGHDVVTASELGLSRAPDTVLLKQAGDDGRIFVTRDKDFGGLVFVGRLGKGVILLRMKPETMDMVHRELTRIVQQYSEEQLRSAFVVVEAAAHRFRKLD